MINPKKERNKAVFVKSFFGFSKDKAKIETGKICKIKIKLLEKEVTGLILQKELKIINKKKARIKKTNREFLKNKIKRVRIKIPTSKEMV